MILRLDVGPNLDTGSHLTRVEFANVHNAHERPVNRISKCAAIAC